MAVVKIKVNVVGMVNVMVRIRIKANVMVRIRIKDMVKISVVVSIRVVNMSDLRQVERLSDVRVAAVLGADFHDSDKPPLARSEETDWLRVQSRYWQQVSRLCDHHRVPFIGAGDWFDDGWRASRCSPALINMMLRNLPWQCYGVPGQHDLKHHRLDTIRETAYWTLVESGKLIHLEADKPVEVGGMVPLRLWGFPWGCEVQPLKEPNDLVMEVAVIHAMIYTNATRHVGAAESAHIKAWKPKLQGYDVAVFGDNHSPFDRKLGDCLVWNNGGFMRRRSDEIDHKPRVGLLYSDGTIKPHYLNIKKDKLAAPTESVDSIPAGLEDFVRELRELTDRSLDFQDAVVRWMDAESVTDGVRRKVLKALGGA